MIQEEQIRNAITSIIQAIGEDPTREGLRDTPRRAAQMYRELFSGLEDDPCQVLRTGFEEGVQGMVALRNVPFFSMCEHHLLPFFGTAHIGYIPRGRVVGASKLARALDILAKRPQIQERLTGQVADAIFDTLRPEGVGVVIQAEHLCMSMRGVKKPGILIVTSATRGEFKSLDVGPAAFLALLKES